MNYLDREEELQYLANLEVDDLKTQFDRFVSSIPRMPDRCDNIQPPKWVVPTVPFPNADPAQLLANCQPALLARSRAAYVLASLSKPVISDSGKDAMSIESADSSGSDEENQYPYPKNGWK